MLTFIFVSYRMKFLWIRNARIDSFLASTADAFSTFNSSLRSWSVWVLRRATWYSIPIFALQYCIRRCSLQVMENHHLSVEKYWSHFDFIIHRDCTSFSTLSIMNMELLQSTPHSEQTYSFAILFRFVQVQWQDEKSPVRLLVQSSSDRGSGQHCLARGYRCCSVSVRKKLFGGGPLIRRVRFSLLLLLC